MTPREQQGTGVEPGLVQRISQGVRYVVSGVTPDSWFGPAQPLAPVAQDKADGRAFDYPVGYNLRISPRSEEAISFRELRGLADGYDLLRLVLETRKDQIESFQWEIVPQDEKASTAQFADAIKTATDFMQSPDKEHGFGQWLRMMVEDILVIDAFCVYPRQTRGGQLYALELVDGATLKRVLDEQGRTPLPPSPAYQQILKGIPAVDYSRDQLHYAMRNPRTWKIYGLSPVEQIIMTVNIALRRQVHQLQFYTEGNIPEAIAQLPSTWDIKQVKDFQAWWDSLMEGNTAQRRKMKFIPNLEGILFPKADVLKDEYDEWLARVVCFAFSIAPTALIKQTNRATAEKVADTAKEEGLLPLLRFLEAQFTLLIQRYLGAQGLRFRWKLTNAVDPKTQAEVHSLYMQGRVLTPDEVRVDIGKEALSAEQRATLFPQPAAPPEFGEDETGSATESKVPESEEPSEAEKMLASLIPLLAPERIARVLAEHGAHLSKVAEGAIRAQPPTVVEFRPVTNVEVGDTNVSLPRPAAPPPDLNKLAPRDAMLGKVFVASRRADGSLVGQWQDAPPVPVTLTKETAV